MSKPLLGPQQLKIGGLIVNFFSDSAVSVIELMAKGGIRRIRSHQIDNSIASMIVIERIGLDGRLSISSEIELFLDEYELKLDQHEQLRFPEGVLDDSIEFEKYVGGSMDPSYCGLVVRSGEALIVLVMMRGNGGLSEEFYDELKSCISISRG